MWTINLWKSKCSRKEILGRWLCMLATQKQHWPWPVWVLVRGRGLGLTTTGYLWGFDKVGFWSFGDEASMDRAPYLKVHHLHCKYTFSSLTVSREGRGSQSSDKVLEHQGRAHSYKTPHQHASPNMHISTHNTPRASRWHLPPPNPHIPHAQCTYSLHPPADCKSDMPHPNGKGERYVRYTHCW